MSIRGLFLPLALIITATIQLHFLDPFTAWRNSGLPPTIIITVSIVALFLFILYPLKRVSYAPFSALLTTAAMLALLLAPTIWTVLPILENHNSAFPVAGPYGTTTPSPITRSLLATGSSRTDTSTTHILSITDFKLLHFLATHQGKASYLFATTTSNYSEAVIIETGKGVMTMGGYAGADQILTPARLSDLVRRGIVRYFLLPGTIPGLLRKLSDWIVSSCERVPYSEWYPNKSFPQGTHIAGLRLYEYTGISPLRPKPLHHRHPIRFHRASPIKV